MSSNMLRSPHQQAFAVGVAHRVEVTRAASRIACRVRGTAVGNATVPARGPGSAAGNFTLRVMLSHYFTAAIDNFHVAAA